MVETNAFFNKVVFQHNGVIRVEVMALSKGSQLAISMVCFVHNSLVLLWRCHAGFDISPYEEPRELWDRERGLYGGL